jgi:replicative DNA helicase
MISETFLNICFDLILARKPKEVDLTIMLDIRRCLDFFEKNEGEDIPITSRNKFDLLKRGCKEILDGKDVNHVKLIPEISEKYRHMKDFVQMKSESKLDEKTFADSLKVIHDMTAWMQIAEKYKRWENCISKIKEGVFETMEEGISEYKELVKSSFNDVMDHETKSSRELVSSLNVPNDDLTSVIEEVKKKYSKQNVIPSGISELDEEYLFGGFQPSRVYLFGGTSGVGKSILLLNFAIRGSMSKRVFNTPFDALMASDLLTQVPKQVFLYVTLENHAYETWIRLYCALFGKTKKEMFDALNASFSPEIIQREIGGLLAPYNCSIQLEYFPSGSLSPIDIVALIKKNSMNPSEKAVKAVYIDYLDLLRADKKSESYRLDLGAITSSLKTIAGSFEVPIITATQLNREAYRKEGGKDPGIETISESIQKIFIADFGAIMKKEDNGNNQPNGDSEIRPVKVALKVEKNRDGKLGKVDIYLDYPRSRMMTKPI